MPRAYVLVGIARMLFPRLLRRVMDGGAAKSLATKTGPGTE